MKRQDAERRKMMEFGAGNETTIFHGMRLFVLAWRACFIYYLGSSERDYLGRTYLHVPNDVDVDLTTDAVPECFLPKKLIHTW
jgi:hypothetical protein